MNYPDHFNLEGSSEALTVCVCLQCVLGKCILPEKISCIKRLNGDCTMWQNLPNCAAKVSLITNIRYAISSNTVIIWLLQCALQHLQEHFCIFHVKWHMAEIKGPVCSFCHSLEPSSYLVCLALLLCRILTHFSHPSLDLEVHLRLLGISGPLQLHHPNLALRYCGDAEVPRLLFHWLGFGPLSWREWPESSGQHLWP